MSTNAKKNTTQYVLVDLSHPAHINFFKHFITKVRNDGFNVTIIALDRAKVPDIIRKEIPDCPIVIVGKQGRSKWSIYLQTGIVRTLQLGFFLLRHPCDFATGVVAYQLGFWGKLFRFPVIGVYDDPGHCLNFRLSCTLLSRLYIPACTGSQKGNQITFNALKEWAYLSPRYFKPRIEVLKDYGVNPYEYLFIRKVDTRTLNYLGQTQDPIEQMYNKDLSGQTTLLSLENKKIANRYSKWRILEEPVEDIHSLMYHSRAVISDGDSMAREGAMLGRPAIYMGQRDMPANNLLIQKELLQNITSADEAIDFLKKNTSDCDPQKQDSIREKLALEWEDINNIMYSAFKELIRRKK